MGDNKGRAKLNDLAIRLNCLMLIILSAEVISKFEECIIACGVQFYNLAINDPGFIVLS